jgi:hypothetical protein
MLIRSLRLAPLQALFAGSALLALATPPAPAQQVTLQPVPAVSTVGYQTSVGCPPPPCAGAPVPGTPGTAPSNIFDMTGPGGGGAGGAGGAADGGMAGGAGLSLEGGGTSAAIGGGTVAMDAAGYIDDAIPRSMIRLRFDAAYDDNRPDRAEFFYAKCGCFRAASNFTQRAPGPPLPETSVDYQEISTYIEYAASDRVSGFINLPVRFINPEQNRDFTGFGDMDFGAKLAFVANTDTYLTFQGRVYVPTGDAFKGLGTRHTTLEPALLLYQRLSDRIAMQAELRDWIPVGGTPDWEGNVIRYGFGFDYLLYNRTNFRILPVVELVGWTVLGGQELAAASPVFTAPQSADGDTIVNAKVGVRVGFGAMEERGMLSRSDLYVGYGRALTGDVWYKDILRVEFRVQY